ncbi:MAG: sigma-70 family RNA polymerase sigma factor [Xanthomonadales bacterium]|nr:sigma-70 family RNA polymerase sigma factor [Xanthomonadales bacterium]
MIARYCRIDQHFEQVAENFGPALMRLARSHEFDDELRAELYQDIMLAIWQALPKLRDPERLRAYVFRIAHNCAARHVAQQVNHRSLPLTDEPVESGHCPQRHTEQQERHDRLMLAIQRLPLGRRAALTLFLEGLSHAEIAEVLDISENNVAVRINRARTQLKEVMAS